MMTDQQFTEIELEEQVETEAIQRLEDDGGPPRLEPTETFTILHCYGGDMPVLVEQSVSCEHPPEAIECNYGLAGDNGCGIYNYCTLCYTVIEKSPDPDEVWPGLGDK